MLSKALKKAYPTLHLSYVAAPHRLHIADIPGYNPEALDCPVAEAPEAFGWWRRTDRVVRGGDARGREAGVETETEVVYEGIETGLAAVADCIRAEGPFDGVMGFSQGATAAAMVASLLEGRRRKEAFEEAEGRGGMPFPNSFLGDVDGFVQGPLKFAVCYSGFRGPGRLYEGFYEPKIGTEVLSVLGQLDTVVDEVRARQLVDACEGGRVLMHPGGHFVPSQKLSLDPVVGFVKQCMEGKGTKEDAEEERVEDMDVPF